MEKKFLIPTIIGVLLSVGIVFTVVYKKSSNNPVDPTPVETVAPKETEPIETRVSGNDNTLEDFKTNETQEIHGQDLNELAGGLILARDPSNIIIESSEISEDVETLSDEEMQKAMEEQAALQYTRPYNSELDEEVYSDEELESIANETDGDLSKYEMDTSYLDDPEKVQEILEEMGY